ILGTPVLRVPPQPNSSGAELAAGPRLSGTASGQSAFESLALRAVPRCCSPARWRECGKAGFRTFEPRAINEPAQSRPRCGRDVGNEFGTFSGRVAGKDEFRIL